MNNMHMIDFHTHILPKMDDGSDSIETSLSMLMHLEEQGIKDVVFTPHYYSQREPLDRFLARRAKSFQALQDAYNGSIRFHLAAEVYYSDYLFNLDDISELCLPGTDVMLLEIPYNKTIDERQLDSIWRLSSEFNVTPLLAHIERYPSIVKSNRMIENVLQIGCLLQVNISSFERFGRRRLISLVNRGVIDAIGTDCHNMRSRMPSYSSGFEVLKKRVHEERVQQLMHSMQSLLNTD